MAQEQPANFACPNYPFCAIEAIAPAAAVPAAYQPHMDLYWAQRQALYQPVVDYSLPGMDQWYAAQAAVSISCISFISILIHIVFTIAKGILKYIPFHCSKKHEWDYTQEMPSTKLKLPELSKNKLDLLLTLPKDIKSIR